MKKLFFVLVVLIVLAAAVVGVFLVTFDANRFKPLVVEKIEQAIGSPVKLERISLVWKNGAALELRGLAVYKDRQTMDKAVAAIDRAAVNVNLMPLLNKQLEITSVNLVRPQLNIIKGPDGIVRVNGINPPPAAPSSGRGTGPSRAGDFTLDSFLVNTVRIDGAQIGYGDFSDNPPVRVQIRKMDIVLKNISFDRPIDFTAKLGLFSSSQNLSASGRVRIPGPQGPYELTDFSLTADLGSLNLNEMEQAVPSMRNADLSGLDGTLAVSAKRFEIDKTGLVSMNSDVTVKNGKAQLKAVRGALSNLNLSSNATERDLTVRSLSADLARGHVDFKGVSRGYLTDSPLSEVSVSAKSLSIEELVETAPGQPGITGRVSADLEGRATGLAWPTISSSLNGQAHVAVEEPVIRNFNLLRVIFDNLGRVPGVSAFVAQNLPPRFQPQMQGRDTVLRPVELNATIADGDMRFDRLMLQTDAFIIAAAGRIGLNGSLDLQTTVVLDPELSRALAANVPQLQYVADPQGNLAFPVRITGTAQRLVITPDMDYVLSRVLATKGREVLSDILQKAMKKQEGSQPAPAAEGQPAAQPAAAAPAGSTDAQASPEDQYKQMLGKLFQ